MTQPHICCCEPSTQCIESDVIGSCIGLVTDPDCGIKPTVGEFAVLVQQCGGSNNTFVCIPPFGPNCETTTIHTAAAPREATYTIEGDIDGLPPCHWIWYSKARAIAFDVNFPSTNRCCCKGEYYTFTCDNPNITPCSTPWECDCAGLPSNHGALTDEICTGLSGCQSVGSYDYELDGGTPPGVIPPGVGGIGNNVFFSKYPAATNGEEGQDDFGSSPAVLTRNLAGLTAYQLRVTEIAYPWVWEINRFNSGKPVKINGASYAYTRPDGNEGSALKYRASDPSVTNQDATGGHPLFRYFHAFAHAEFAWKKTADFPITAGTSQPLWQQSTPYKFYFVADGFPVFAFELTTEERATFYPAQQYSGGVVERLLRESADSVDAMLKSGTWVSRAAAKDWRGEVYADLQTLATWGNAQRPAWSDPQDFLDTTDGVESLKFMFPNRLPGDVYDVRAIDVVTGNTTTVRPPALAAASQAVAYDMNYVDSITSANTGQVDSAVYNMAEPSIGLAAMPATEADAFKRLTRSIYFRTQPAGWDWSVAAHEGISTQKPRYNWLNDRQQGDVNLSQALRWTCKVTDPPCAYDNVWCTTGQPQDGSVSTTCTGQVCINNICDLYSGHAGYAGNPNILVGRGEYPHSDEGDSSSCCEPLPLAAHAQSDPVQADSNICFFRHAGRPYYWDTTIAPFAMQLVTSLVPPQHPIDSIPTCGPFPAISTQNDSGGGAVQFCNDQPGCGTYCNALTCSTYSYSVYIPFCTLQDCSQTLAALDVPFRPPGSIAGQREAPYIGYSACVIVAPTPDDNCICPVNCSLLFPVVTATPPPP